MQPLCPEYHLGDFWKPASPPAPVKHIHPVERINLSCSEPVICCFQYVPRMSCLCVHFPYQSVEAGQLDLACRSLCLPCTLPMGSEMLDPCFPERRLTTQHSGCSSLHLSNTPGGRVMGLASMGSSPPLCPRQPGAFCLASLLSKLSCHQALNLG